MLLRLILRCFEGFSPPDSERETLTDSVYWNRFIKEFYSVTQAVCFALNHTNLLFLLSSFLFSSSLSQALQQWCHRVEDISNSELHAMPFSSPLFPYRYMGFFFLYACGKINDAQHFKNTQSPTSASAFFSPFFFFLFFLCYSKLADSFSFRPNLIFIHSVREDVFFFLPFPN